jgi:hypothetical protein
MAAAKGKPCGASYIAGSKVCRVGLATEVNRAMNAAAGEIGAASLKAAVQKYAGGKGVERLRELRRDIKEEMGGNIVKGPRADELKRRLQAEGLLPNGKAKSVAPEAPAPSNRSPKKEYNKPQGAQELEDRRDRLLSEGIKAMRAKDDAKYAKLQEEFNKVQGELNRRNKGEAPQRVSEPKAPSEPPDPKWGVWGTDQLRDKYRAAKGLDKNAEARIKKELARRGVDADAPPPPPPERPKGVTQWTLDTMKSIDKDVEENTTARYGQKGYDWNDSLTGGAKLLGGGAFGTAIRGADKNVVKRGEIGQNEAAIIEKVGKLGLGPKLIAAELDGPGYQGDTKKGRLAMTIVSGKEIGFKGYESETNGVKTGDAFWTARAKLHRAGVAHNDMHGGNIFVNSKGEAKFVDLGLAQDSPKAALAEAMGAFRVLPVRRNRDADDMGDWQVKRWDFAGGAELRDAERYKDTESFSRRFPVAGKVLENKEKAIMKLKGYGLNDNDVSDVMAHGIRMPENSFNKGGMGKITDDQAMEVINTLYEGI